MPEYGLGLRRLVLDQLLVTRALSERSVRLLEHRRVCDLSYVDGQWQVSTSEGERFCAPLLVAADGYRSTVRRSLGWQAPAVGRRYGVVGHLRIDRAQAEALGSDIHVVMRQGLEAYCAPAGGNDLLVAFLGERPLMRSLAGDAARGYRRWIETDPILSTLLSKGVLSSTVTVCGPFPAQATRVFGEGVILIGDAAGFLDPISGEGLARSLRGARLAAHVAGRALSHGSVSAGSLAPYARGLARLTRDGQWLTRLALLVCGSEHLKSLAIRGLQRDPNLLARLLGVSAGAWGFGALSLRDWIALFAGV